MKSLVRAAAITGALLVAAASAHAQNLSLSAPAWAQSLLAADVTPTTGGRAVLAADGVALSVRVTIAPNSGGVARVIRYDLRGEEGTLALRRFTGHPATGWWLWGGDTPRVGAASAAERAEIAQLARAAMTVANAAASASAEQSCARGEQAYVEIALGARAQSFARSCAASSDAAGRLALRMSEIAGSRTEEELAEAAVRELLAVDRAFAQRARREGVGAAFAAYAASDALMVTRSDIFTGAAGVAQRYAAWPEGARLEWSPESARVSARGDMGWTWGNWLYVAPDGTREAGRYVTVWTRDYEGDWRFAFDASID